MTGACPDLIPADDSQIVVDGQVVTVVTARATDAGADVFILRTDGKPDMVSLTCAQLATAAAPTRDGSGNPHRALAGLWGRGCSHASRASAPRCSRPGRCEPFAHQDEAVFTHMLPQPRLRFLLADEPGTGKTIMTGMYLAEGTPARAASRPHGHCRPRAPGREMAAGPAPLLRDRRRADHPGDRARPADLDPRYRGLGRQRRPVHPQRRRAPEGRPGSRASWSLAVFDEAHRLTPTSRYLAAARELADRSHHLLLLTATPHRGKEHFFRGLLNLLDAELYPWDPDEPSYDTALRPSRCRSFAG